MEDWRLIAFAVFMFAIVTVAWGLLLRRRRAQRIGDDPVYGVASPTPEPIEQPRAALRPRGVGTSSDAS